jgi:type IV pilus assembly protein PilM
MAEPESTVALNIGSQQISMAVFEPAKNGGLILKGYDSTSILADPAAEMARLPQIKLAISELAERMKVSKAKVRYAISGQSVFTRFVKLPPIEEENIDQLVAFEAQQHVPFPIDEVIWDWVAIDSGGIEKEVALVAIKGDALNEINDVVGETGLGTEEVDASPLALYNAFKFSYPDEQDPVLLADVGAKATTLVYVEGKRVFTRSLNVGGVAITTAIAKEYGISFAEAEAQKITNGLVSLGGGHTEQLDEPSAALATVIRNAMNRLPSEIARTNNYYRSQQGGSAPTKVYLAGGGANLPYLREFLEEKLRLPVEFFNPLTRVSIAKGLDVDALGPCSHMMGELVGLGLRGVDQAPLRIDLVPSQVESERATAKRKPFLMAATALFLAGLGTWCAYKSHAANLAEKKASVIARKVSGLETFDVQLTKLDKAVNKLGSEGIAYASAENQRVELVRLYNELKDTFASTSVWLTDLDPLVGYSKGDVQSGSSHIKAKFPATSYGTSSLAEVKNRPAAGPRKQQQASRNINAIRISGFWRTSALNHNAVNQIVDKIRNAEGGAFNLKVKKGDQMEPMKDDQIFVTFSPSILVADDLAAPFTMILPLSREIPIN